MKKLKFKVGDKVRMTSKSVLNSLSDSVIFKRSWRGIGYITRNDPSEEYYVVDTKKGTTTGDYFLEKDLEFLIKEEEALYKLKS